MIHGKGLSRAAHAGHDFVCNEKNFAVPADFADAVCVAVGRTYCAECGADDWFEDECRNGRRIVRGKKGSEILGAGDVAGWKRFVEGTEVAEAGRDVAPFRLKRLIRSAAC